MKILASQIFINPFSVSPHGVRYNTYEYGEDDTSVRGWNVQAYGLMDGTAGVLDDKDFADLDSAYAYAQKLAREYQIEIEGMRTVQMPQVLPVILPA